MTELDAFCIAFESSEKEALEAAQHDKEKQTHIERNRYIAFFTDIVE